MKTIRPRIAASVLRTSVHLLSALLLLTASLQAQTLLNIDFGVGPPVVARAA